MSFPLSVLLALNLTRVCAFHEKTTPSVLRLTSPKEQSTGNASQNAAAASAAEEQKRRFRLEQFRNFFQAIANEELNAETDVRAGRKPSRPLDLVHGLGLSANDDRLIRILSAETWNRLVQSGDSFVRSNSTRLNDPEREEMRTKAENEQLKIVEEAKANLERQLGKETFQKLARLIAEMYPEVTPKVFRRAESVTAQRPGQGDQLCDSKVKR